MLPFINGIFQLFMLGMGVLVWYCNRKNQKEVQLMKQLERYVGNLLSEYGKNKDLLDALEQSILPEDVQLAREIGRIRDALEEGGFSDSAEYYMKTAPNPYLAMFYSLCHTIRSFGDLEYQGISLFTRNVKYIKEELRMELLRLQQQGYLYSGLLPLCIVPFFLLLPIQWWATSVTEGMGTFYEGMYGLCSLCICFFVSVVSVWVILQLKGAIEWNIKAGKMTERLLKQPIVATVVEWIMSRNYTKYLKKNEELKVLQGFGNIRIFLMRKLGYGIATGSIATIIFLLFVKQSHASHLGIWFLLPMLCACVGYHLPEIAVVLGKLRVNRQKTEETLRFQTMILVLMHYPQITVEEILKFMERFALLFQKALQKAVDEFSHDRKAALDLLKEELAYEPAVRLAESLENCDDLPISLAFYDLENEREYYMEQYKQQSFDTLRECAAVAKLIAFLPFITVLGLRLVGPFLLEGLSRLGAYQTMF